ncbi:MAG: DNA starvation/stationary phase protection protein [Planctomycetota bacterium]|nr:DNA starvation/stationary phase protection protein [Planctomycetota bacterium]
MPDLDMMASVAGGNSGGLEQPTVRKGNIMTTDSSTIAGLDEQQSIRVTKTLTGVLADHVVLRMKLQNVHWNIFGPLFHSVHTMTEQRYLALTPSIDAIAERIRALGHPAPGRLGYLLKQSCLDEEGDGQLLDDLLDSCQQVVQQTRACCQTATALGDEITADMLIGIIGDHDEFIWQLRSLTA